VHAESLRQLRTRIDASARWFVQFTAAVSDISCAPLYQWRAPRARAIVHALRSLPLFMTFAYALPVLVALIAALLCVRHVAQRRRQQRELLRRSTGRSAHSDLRRASPRSEMRYGEDSAALVEEISARPQPFRAPATPPVGATAIDRRPENPGDAAESARCQVHPR
jgi:hypothetical protein